MKIQLVSLVVFKKYPDKSFLRMQYGEQWLVSLDQKWATASFVEVPYHDRRELEELFSSEEDEDL